MKPIPKINLDAVVSCVESLVIDNDRKRIEQLVMDRINHRNRLRDQIERLEDELGDVEKSLSKIREGDWSLLNWKPDTSEL